MQQLGYADFDPPTWTYVPSPVFATLLDWVRDFLTREVRLLEFVAALNSDTRETINISRRASSKVRIMHGLESIHSVGVSVKPGTVMPVTQSLTGLTALATMGLRECNEFLEDLKVNDPRQAESVKPELIKSIREEFLQNGMVKRCDVFITGIGALCLPVNMASSNEILVVGVVGPSDRIEANQTAYRDSVKRLVKEHGIDVVRSTNN